VNTKKEERTIGFISKSPPFIHVTIEIKPAANMLDDGD
jgi:hypothetical protein